MKLVFVSNYFNHHQKALAEEFVKIYGSDYAFIAMTPFNQKRLSIGYSDMNNAPFVLRAYESGEAMREAQEMINDSECVIIGGMPVHVVAERLRHNKLTFMQSEHFFKGPLWKDAVRFVKYVRYSGGRAAARDRQARFYLLCASGFAARDYGMCGLFRDKAYKWGYFPEVKRYDVDELMSRKEKGSILWVGRFLDWKHPDLAVRMARNLKAEGKSFRLKIIGSGEMQSELARMIDDWGLDDCVEVSGALPAERVRDEMERAETFLFTSDRGEGWGVVLNEAMNSGCAVVGSDGAGATRYLVKDGHNGLMFRDKDERDLTEKVRAVLDGGVSVRELGVRAYKTVSEEWSAGNAALRFVELWERLRVSEGDGPCSLA